MRRATYWAVAAVALAAVATLVYLKTPLRADLSDGRTKTARDEQLRALAGNVEQLREELQATRMMALAAAQAPDERAEAEAEPDDSKPEDADTTLPESHPDDEGDTLALAQERDREKATFYRGQLAAEPPNHDRAQHFEAALAPSLLSDFQGTSLHDVQCGSTLCQLTFDHTSADVQDSEWMKIVTSTAFNDIRGWAMKDSEPGRPRTTIFTAPPGQDLPSPP